MSIIAAAETIVRRLGRKVAASSRSTKRSIAMLSDALAIPACLGGAVWLIAPELLTILPLWLWCFAAIAPLLVVQRMGLYRSVVRFMGTELMVAGVKSASLMLLLVLPLVTVFDNFSDVGRAGVGFWFLSINYLIGSRLTVRWLLQVRSHGGERVIIYGAGQAGAQLVKAIVGRGEFETVAFADDNAKVQGAFINGVEVYAPSRIAGLVEQFAVSRVLLALPSVSRRRRQEIIRELERLPVHVQTIPSTSNLISGIARVDELHEVDITDLLGRDPVPPIPELLHACIRGKSVMVTGAGGSIGSELCRQIFVLKPRCLILLEISEAALYLIDQALREIAQKKGSEVQIISLIGSAHHKKRVQEVLEAYQVDTVYHAAAYKHVPLVEYNMIEGVHNNVFGTLHAAQAAIAAGVSSFVLVSTDKAVKPTNVMGATKRFSELVLQALSKRGLSTTFSMVRFGNVLASSGSVVPLFRQQIRSGGPVTVTHPDIYRYFMTIPEAASLVIQAGSMAQGGDVFVLDMGKPVRIRDLAEKMIHLMGLTVRDEAQPEGDVEILYTGLRPAEKLCEELLIGNNVMATPHPSIMRAHEAFLTWNELEPLLDQLWDACQRLDCEKAREVLLRAETGYSPTKEVQDLVWQHRNSGTREWEFEGFVSATGTVG